MNTPQNHWPDNVRQFRIAGFAMSAFDQKMMVSLRRLADRTGETVEEHIHRAIAQFVKCCEADGELPTKIIPFPKQTAVQEERATGSDDSAGRPDESRKRGRVQRAVSALAWKQKPLRGEARRLIGSVD